MRMLELRYRLTIHCGMSEHDTSAAYHKLPNPDIRAGVSHDGLVVDATVVEPVDTSHITDAQTDHRYDDGTLAYVIVRGGFVSEHDDTRR